MMTKKNILMLSIVLTGLFLVFGFQKNIGLCGKEYNTCWDFFDLLWPPFFLGIPIFLISILTYRMREEIFYAWVKFGYVWIPLSLLIIFTTPTVDHSWAIGGLTRDTVTFVMSGLFLIISLILIAYKFFKLKKSGTGK